MNQMAQDYRVYAVDGEGQRQPLSVHGLVIELEPGKELELVLQAHPNHPGQLLVRTGSELEAGSAGGSLAVLVVRPGGCNQLHLAVEHHPWRDLS
ncbi:hypothetical protein [Pseudaeromonas paramecii]|uniref:Uncharacterized protein n=1 Tax=Pseudaeromonas paramecii TaxID=2138166 RepID=A0ABP8QGH1_9GAMM